PPDIRGASGSVRIRQPAPATTQTGDRPHGTDVRTEHPMTAQYPITQDLLAEQAEEAARLAQIQQIASASQVTGPQSPPNAAPLPRIDLDTGYIAFHGGVPVGGFSHLTVYADGSYAYTGHFH